MAVVRRVPWSSCRWKSRQAFGQKSTSVYIKKQGVFEACYELRIIIPCICYPTLGERVNQPGGAEGILPRRERVML